MHGLAKNIFTCNDEQNRNVVCVCVCAVDENVIILKNYIWFGQTLMATVCVIYTN